MTILVPVWTLFVAAFVLVGIFIITRSDNDAPVAVGLCFIWFGLGLMFGRISC